MPNPPSKKERIARFISGLRSNRRGSLVVQTGFPTSIADLVVKNRARLKKPSKKKKPTLSSDHASAASTADGGQSSDSGDDLQVPVVENPNEIDGEIVISAPTPLATRRRVLGFEFRFLVVKLVVLVLLAIGKKKIVVGITMSALGLLMIEFSVFLKPRSDWRNESGPTISKLDLRGREFVSPIREVEIDGDPRDSSGSERNWQKSEELDSSSEMLIERRDLAVIQNITKDQHLGDELRSSKKKKLFRKLFRRKFRGRKDEKELILTLDGREVVDNKVEEEEIIGVENNNGIALSFEQASDEVSKFSEEGADVVVENSCETRQWSCRKFVFLVLVLLGLLGGRVVALVLTVIWYLLSGCTQTAWKKWRKH